MSVCALRLVRAAAVAALAAAVAACSTPDRRTQEERAADRALAGRVEAALSADGYTDAANVVVDARGGVVRLSGKVGNASDLRSVLRTCAAVPGVRRVDDELEINDFGQMVSPRR